MATTYRSDPIRLTREELERWFSFYRPAEYVEPTVEMDVQITLPKGVAHSHILIQLIEPGECPLFELQYK